MTKIEVGKKYSADDLFKNLGLDVLEVQKQDGALRERNTRDGRICICGHAMRRHIIVDNRTDLMSCSPNRHHCSCKYQNMRGVIEVKDIRTFNRKTEGPGVSHALLRGMQASKDEITILEPFKCEVCGTTEGGVVPVPIDPKTGAVSPLVYYGYDQFRCQGCMGARYES